MSSTGACHTNLASTSNERPGKELYKCGKFLFSATLLPWLGQSFHSFSQQTVLQLRTIHQVINTVNIPTTPWILYSYIFAAPSLESGDWRLDICRTTPSPLQTDRYNTLEIAHRQSSNGDIRDINIARYPQRR